MVGVEDKQEMTQAGNDNQPKRKKESVLDSKVMKHEALLISKRGARWEANASVTPQPP